jgi:ADP-heptose:LPS heptosyltransferase
MMQRRPALVRVLVIKFGALGDFAQAFGVFGQIRAAHPQARITLLTTPPYKGLALQCGSFDAVETDGRPAGWRAQLALLRRLRRARYDRVYDLQTSDRSAAYFYALWPRPPQWSGHARFASHRQTRPDRDELHNLDRLADQLHVAGIGPPVGPPGAEPPHLDWAVELARAGEPSTAGRFGVEPPFVLVAPGASPVKPAKLWPVERYGELAVKLCAAGLTPVIVGSQAEGPLAQAIVSAAPGSRDLTGRTQMVDLAGLGAEAAFCVGNDTGPTHMAAYAGAGGLMLMSRESKPSHCGPRGRMRSLQVDNLADLSVASVWDALAVAGCDLSPPGRPALGPAARL